MQKRTLAPSTRYLGSKLSISNWILKNLEDIEYNSVLECFGGTGTIGYTNHVVKDTVNAVLSILQAEKVKACQYRPTSPDIEVLLKDGVD